MRIMLYMTQNQIEAVNEAYHKPGECSVLRCKKPLGASRLVYAQPKSNISFDAGKLMVDFVCKDCSNSGGNDANG